MPKEMDHWAEVAPLHFDPDTRVALIAQSEAKSIGLTTTQLLLPLLTELLGALHDEGVLTSTQSARVVAAWNAALASWEKREGMRLSAQLTSSALQAEAAHRLPGVAPDAPGKPVRLTRVPRN